MGVKGHNFRVFQGFLLFFVCISLFLQGCKSEQSKRVNIYCWSDSFYPELIQDFEKETGIKVYKDSFDSNDTLESKILLGISGYDVVFPTLWPYFARQAKAGFFLALDKNKLTFWKDLDPTLMEKVKAADPQLTYGIPYTWGATGIAYNKKKLKDLPNIPCDSSRMLFDQQSLATIAHCGVAFMEEALDVIPAVMHYLGTDDKKKAVAHLMGLRPYIRRFNWSRSLQDLANGEICMAQTIFSSAYKLKLELQQTKSDIDLEVFIPEEGASVWIDMIAIPKNAPHVENAYKFINFLMRPENLAKISNYLYEMNSNLKSTRYLTDDVMQMYHQIKKSQHKFYDTPVSSREELKDYGEAMEQIIYSSNK